MATAHITISRVHARGNSNSAALYNILIDGTEVGTIADDESKTFDVTPGPHTVMAKINWCRSPSVRVTVPEGREVLLKCRAASTIFDVLYRLTVGYRRYIQLEVLAS